MSARHGIVGGTLGLVLTLARHEWVLRARRSSSLLILGLVIAASWLMIPDNTGEVTLFAVNDQRMLYDSHTLSVGGGMMGNLLFGLLGFFLVRGRTQQDLQHGAAALLATAPAPAFGLLLSRWLGAVAFLMTLAGVDLLTVMLLQLMHGEAPLQLGPYLAMWLLGMGPPLLLCASVALLCDAWAPLMRRRGDLFFFACWVGQFAALPFTLDKDAQGLHPILALDLSGMSALALRLGQLMGTNSVSIGVSSFDPALGVGQLPEGVWSWPLVALRLASAGLALLPLLPALWLFHRYDPDRVRPAAAKTGSRWRTALVNAQQPLARLAGRLLPLCARVPGWPGQVLAQVCLALVGQPWALLALPLMMVLGLSLPLASLGPVVLVSTACWGVMVCGLGAQDHQARTLALAAVAPGGPERRRLTPFASAALLGLLFHAPVLVRWGMQAPLQALALLSGLLLLSSLSALLGHWTAGSRTFLALFLFWLYAATQASIFPWLDLMGFNGRALPLTAGVYALVGLTGLGLLALRRGRA
ncbi:hypothetical protein [Pelomonas sp. BJYL3]|uniref:hypothetical protein n=1 Tax=Pelomonas sp. BJYL3 TaxID=2976697 RepID=UPI0022B4C356|nr:hypothetical protein [Pelomonas sp. BJYL3]